MVILTLLLMLAGGQAVDDAGRLIELAELRRDSTLLQRAEEALRGTPAAPDRPLLEGRLASARSEALRAAGKDREADRLLDSAIDALDRAMERRAGTAKEYALLTDLLGRKIGLGGFFTVMRHQGRMEEALKRAQQLGDAEADVQLAVGRNAYHTPEAYGGSLERAIDHFRRAAGIAPQRALTHFWLARALERGGKISEAVVHYRAALEIEPGFVDARTRLNRLTK